MVAKWKNVDLNWSVVRYLHHMLLDESAGKSFPTPAPIPYSQQLCCAISTIMFHTDTTLKDE